MVYQSGYQHLTHSVYFYLYSAKSWEVTTVCSQQEGPGFHSVWSLFAVCSLWVLWFPPTVPETCSKLGRLIGDWLSFRLPALLWTLSPVDIIVLASLWDTVPCFTPQKSSFPWLVSLYFLISPAGLSSPENHWWLHQHPPPSCAVQRQSPILHQLPAAGPDRRRVRRRLSLDPQIRLHRLLPAHRSRRWVRIPGRDGVKSSAPVWLSWADTKSHGTFTGKRHGLSDLSYILQREVDVICAPIYLFFQFQST